MNNDYLLDLMVRMAHHSTAIEGNSLSQGETKSILIDHIIPKRMDEREYYEVVNYRKLLPYLLTHKDENIEIQNIKDINKIIMENVGDRGGQFKVIQNGIVGADFIPTPPYQVPEELKKWTDDLSWRLKYSTKDEEKVLTIMEQHLRFEKIHPFSDGNGRTGRALMIWSCLHENITPIVITKEKRNEYINALNRNDIKELTTLAAEIQMQEQERMMIFDDEYRIDKKLLKTLSDELKEAHSTFYQDEVLEDEYSQDRAFLNSVKTKREQEQIKFRVRDYKEHCKDISKDRSAARTRYDDFDEGRHL